MYTKAVSIYRGGDWVYIYTLRWWVYILRQWLYAYWGSDCGYWGSEGIHTEVVIQGNTGARSLDRGKSVAQLWHWLLIAKTIVVHTLVKDVNTVLPAETRSHIDCDTPLSAVQDRQVLSVKTQLYAQISQQTSFKCKNTTLCSENTTLCSVITADKY